MSCNVTQGFTLGCRSNTGGITSIYILSGSISSIDETSGAIDAISGSGTFFEFQLPRNVGQFSETPNASLEAGTVFYEQTVDIAIHKLQTSIRNQVNTITKNPDLKIIVKTNNGTEDGVGQYLYVGRYRGMSVSGGTGGTGTNFGDQNGYALTFTGQEPQPFFEINTTGGDLATALSGITVG